MKTKKKHKGGFCQLQAAVRAAVALCQRHSRDTAPEMAQELWFGVLQAHVTLLRDLRASCNGAESMQPSPERPHFVADTRSPLSLHNATLDTASAPSVQQTSSRNINVSPAKPSANELEKDRRRTAAEACLAALMEQVIGMMAGHVPLRAIGERILAAYAPDPFGSFKVWPCSRYCCDRAKGFSQSLHGGTDIVAWSSSHYTPPPNGQQSALYPDAQ